MHTPSVVGSLFIGNSRLNKKVQDFRLMKYTKTHFNLSNNPVYKKKNISQVERSGSTTKDFQLKSKEIQ